MKRVIEKAKITKHHTLEVHYVRHNEDDTTNAVDEKEHENLVHPDLQAAFAKLIPHMVSIVDLREADIIGTGRNKFLIDAVPAEHFAKFTVTGFSIGGSAEGEGITITGNKKLNSSQVFNINTPFQKYDDELSDYKYGSELAEAVQACVYEVEQYLGGKCAAKQVQMQFNPSEEEELQEAAAK
jgi:hypothetical protein